MLGTSPHFSYFFIALWHDFCSIYSELKTNTIMMIHPEKYSFDELYAHFLEKGGLTTKRNYKGFDIIISSRQGCGVNYFFYKNGKFVKQRNWNWHPQIEEYPKRYIDEVLNKIESE